MGWGDICMYACVFFLFLCCEKHFLRQGRLCITEQLLIEEREGGRE